MPRGVEAVGLSFSAKFCTLDDALLDAASRCFIKVSLSSREIIGGPSNITFSKDGEFTVPRGAEAVGLSFSAKFRTFDEVLLEATVASFCCDETLILNAGLCC